MDSGVCDYAYASEGLLHGYLPPLTIIWRKVSNDKNKKASLLPSIWEPGPYRRRGGEKLKRIIPSCNSSCRFLVLADIMLIVGKKAASPE